MIIYRTWLQELYERSHQCGLIFENQFSVLEDKWDTLIILDAPYLRKEVLWASEDFRGRRA
ncbi:hypothetical protein AQV86_00740 [Nanohaloarchaea archaeon SG9]|nr:hypothetical protein AQV86_00740 [Nanohaloarchaea archaeon SG9]